MDPCKFCNSTANEACGDGERREFQKRSAACPCPSVAEFKFDWHQRISGNMLSSNEYLDALFEHVLFVKRSLNYDYSAINTLLAKAADLAQSDQPVIIHSSDHTSVVTQQSLNDPHLPQEGKKVLSKRRKKRFQDYKRPVNEAISAVTKKCQHLDEIIGWMDENKVKVENDMNDQAKRLHASISCCLQTALTNFHERQEQHWGEILQVKMMAMNFRTQLTRVQNMVRGRLSQMQKGEWGIKKTSKMLLKEVQIVLANKPDVQRVSKFTYIVELPEVMEEDIWDLVGYIKFSMENVALLHPQNNSVQISSTCPTTGMNHYYIDPTKVSNLPMIGSEHLSEVSQTMPNTLLSGTVLDQSCRLNFSCDVMGVIVGNSSAVLPVETTQTCQTKGFLETKSIQVQDSHVLSHASALNSQSLDSGGASGEAYYQEQISRERKKSPKHFTIKTFTPSIEPAVKTSSPLATATTELDPLKNPEKATVTGKHISTKVSSPLVVSKKDSVPKQSTKQKLVKASKPLDTTQQEQESIQKKSSKKKSAKIAAPSAVAQKGHKTGQNMPAKQNSVNTKPASTKKCDSQTQTSAKQKPPLALPLKSNSMVKPPPKYNSAEEFPPLSPSSTESDCARNTLTKQNSLKTSNSLTALSVGSDSEKETSPKHRSLITPIPLAALPVGPGITGPGTSMDLVSLTKTNNSKSQQELPKASAPSPGPELASKAPKPVGTKKKEVTIRSKEIENAFISARGTLKTAQTKIENALRVLDNEETKLAGIISWMDNNIEKVKKELEEHVNNLHARIDHYVQKTFRSFYQNLDKYRGEIVKLNTQTMNYREELESMQKRLLKTLRELSTSGEIMSSELQALLSEVQVLLVKESSVQEIIRPTYIMEVTKLSEETCTQLVGHIKIQMA